jgi:hypothetical protein
VLVYADTTDRAGEGRRGRRASGRGRAQEDRRMEDGGTAAVLYERIVRGVGRLHTPALLGLVTPQVSSGHDAGNDEITPLSRRGVRRSVVYADTRGHTDRAVGRGLRASGRLRAREKPVRSSSEGGNEERTGLTTRLL